MPLFHRQLTERVVATACLLAGLGTPGCGWLRDGVLPELPLAAGGRPEEAQKASPPSSLDPTDPAGDPSGDRAVLARGGDAEGRSVWIRAIRPPQGDSAEPEYRWRYPDLEDLLARPPQRRPDWHRHLAAADPIVATNAAIALARSGDASGAEQLADAARGPAINRPMRCAAVEALATLEGPSVVALLRELLEQYGRSTRQAGSTYHADLHAELIRGLARHVDPADDPNFVAALRSRSAEVRVEAVRAWAAGRVGSLPVEVADMRTDGHADVRAALMLTLARRRHGEAHRYLAAAVRDHDVKVRTAAIGALGELGGPEARSTLELLLDDHAEAIRAAAVSALAKSGARQEMLRAAGDRSWRVRLEVARALAGEFAMASSTLLPVEDDPAVMAAAGQLLQDPSAMIQREVVAAVAQWPLQRSGTILLEGLASRSLLTRRTAAEQLAARWPPAMEFPVEGPPQRRQRVREELQRRFREQFGRAEQVSLTEASPGGAPISTITPGQLDHLEQLVRRQDVGALIDFGPDLVEALEQLAFDRHLPLPEVIYREVLPRYGPVYAVLDRLAAAEVSERREAAGELAELAGEGPLGRLAVTRLFQLVVGEPDQLVWHDVLAALASEAGEAPVRLAYAAISHPSAEVRRRACDYLAAHPHPDHAQMLLPALQDRDQGVLRAALGALGAAGDPDAAQPLRRLLRTTNEYLRLETAVALVRLGDPAGAAALQRLAYSTDPKVRRKVATAMGDAADTTYVPALIRLLDDRPAVCHAALEGLHKAVGHDVSASEDQAPAGTPERVRRWKQWFHRGQKPGIATP